MTRVYDLPTRIFHWLFAALFVGAFFIAQVYDDKSAQYPLHMMLGMTLTLTVLLRIIWGLWGSEHARFSSFKLKPRELLAYFKNLLSSKTLRYLGHNPASSWVAILMMVFTLGLAFSGYMMVQGQNKHFFKEVHELVANAFLVTVIGHVVGIALHTWKHKDAIGLSMIHGSKKAVAGDVGIKKNYPIVALLFVLIVGSFVVQLDKNYNRTTQNLNLFGKLLQLGELEQDKEKGKESHEEKDDD